MRDYLLPVLVFSLVLGGTTWGKFWKVKMEPDADACVARVLYCRRDSKVDEYMRDLERESGEKAPPDGTLWCHCVLQEGER
jgi:hypothetical protein